LLGFIPGPVLEIALGRSSREEILLHIAFCSGTPAEIHRQVPVDASEVSFGVL